MAQFTLVLGGVRSGKSRFAEQLAASWPPVTYLATAQAGDAEMAKRIERHRGRRDPSWTTREEAWSLGRTLAEVLAPTQPERQPGCVLVECLPLWLTNLLEGMAGHAGRLDAEIAAEVDNLVEVIQTGAGRVMVVSSEVGCGLMPANSLARRFADLLGEANQRLAAAAQEVYVVLAGLSLRIK